MKNFTITGTYRTGSSALAEIISLHPKVSSGWEWTSRIAWPRKVMVGKRALNGNFHDLPENDRAYMENIHSPEKEFLGYRRFFRASNKWIYHPRSSVALFVDQFIQHMNWWKDSQNISIIHIIRSDNLAWLKSVGLATASGQYFGKVYPDELRVRWNLKEAAKRVLAKNWIDQQLLALRSASVPYLDIKYEDFANNNSGIVQQVLSFLGCDLDYQPVAQPKALIQSKGSMAKLDNVDELKEYLDKRGLLWSTF